MIRRRGGETLVEGLIASEEKDVIQPKAGSCFLMQHRLIHEGAVLKKGVKYVLRSDVMYKRPNA